VTGADEEGKAGGAGERRWTVDRREGRTFVVEMDDGCMVDFPASLLPPHLREGDVILVRSELGEDGARHLTLTVDHEATRAARHAAEAILTRLRARDPGGDIAL
jgi:hypothetical protein